MKILYTARFLRIFKKLPHDVQQEVKTKIDLFVENPNLPILGFHKLSGKFQGRHAFAVNFHYRVIVKLRSDTAYCLDIGTHDVYR